MPLQKSARKRGNSVFLNEQFNPHPDQWAFLSTIQRISRARVEALARARTHRDLAARKLKMSRLLADGGLPDEARTPLLDAAPALGRALAVEARLPEPGAAGEITSPPLAAAWGKHVAALHDFLAVPDADGLHARRAIEELLGIPDDCPF